MIFHSINWCGLYQWFVVASYISSVECNKVVSAFLSFCGKSNFLLRFPLYFIVFLTSWFFNNNVNILSWDLHDPKCLFSHVLSKSGKYSISPKISLTTFLHSHDDLCLYEGFRTHWWVNNQNTAHLMAQTNVFLIKLSKKSLNIKE